MPKRKQEKNYNIFAKRLKEEEEKSRQFDKVSDVVSEILPHKIEEDYITRPENLKEENVVIGNEINNDLDRIIIQDYETMMDQFVVRNLPRENDDDPLKPSLGFPLLALKEHI